jgi:DNA-binding NarL/FixJ family response regulator
MAIRTVNAADVLSPELLTQVSEALGGGSCNLWVPSRRNLNRRHRDRYIQDLHEKGHSAADIARRLFITERTVWRVLARMRAAGPPSDPAAGRGQP